MSSTGRGHDEVAPDPRPAPPDLEGLRRFVNSDNRFRGVDHLQSPHRADWFREALPEWPLEELDEPGWARLARLRDRVRAVLAEEPGAETALSRLAADHPLVVVLGEGGTSGLAPARRGQEAALVAGVLSALHGAAGDGRLARLRLCARPDCGWCFYDASRNRSARWCSSDPCGDVMKVRAFRERERAR